MTERGPTAMMGLRERFVARHEPIDLPAYTPFAWRAMRWDRVGRPAPNETWSDRLRPRRESGNRPCPKNRPPAGLAAGDAMHAAGWAMQHDRDQTGRLR